MPIFRFHFRANSIRRSAVIARRLLGIAGMALAAASAQAASVGNFIWVDANADGAQDSGEPGLPGVSIQLWNSIKTSMIASTTSGPDGSYTLTTPNAGSYRVRVLLPSEADGFTGLDRASGDNQRDSDIHPDGADAGFSDIVFLGSNAASTTAVDCGLLMRRLPGHTIGDRVFHALADGTRPDPFAVYNVGATVDLLDTNGVVLQTTTTQRLGKRFGYYGFAAPPGTYRLRFRPNPTYYFPTPFGNAGGDDTEDSDIDAAGMTPVFTLNSGQIRSDIDAGFVHPVNLQIFVWQDQDADGLQDANEPGVPDVVVELWDDAKSRRWGAGASNTFGNLVLIAPGAGNYRLWALRPLPADAFTSLGSGDDETEDSNIITSGNDYGFSPVFSFPVNQISASNVDVGLVLAPGPRTLTPLRITSFQRATPSSSLTFTGPVGGTYMLEADNGLDEWFSFNAPFLTTSATTTVPIPMTAFPPARYWRIRRTR